MIRKLREKLAELENLEAAANVAEAAYEAEPENAEAEAAFDRAYAAEFSVLVVCIDLVQRISSGKIDTGTARKMIETKRAELVSLLEKTA